VIVVGFKTVRSNAPIPPPVIRILTSADRFIPLSVTFTVPPCGPLAGEIELRVGGGGVTVKGKSQEPKRVVTRTLCVPGVASGDSDRVAVIVAELITLTPDKDTPEPSIWTVASLVK